MKNYKYRNILLTLLIFFVVPCKSWAYDSVKGELSLIVEEIQSRAKEHKNTHVHHSPFIVSIGGCPGVGKSTIAQLLQTELSEIGIMSVMISLDHYGLSQAERKQFTSELDPRRIQWHKIHETLASIVKGEKEIIKPTINQLTKERSQETLHLANVDCILFEGAYALGNFSPMDFLQYADMTIYLESPLENMYDWKWQRELKKATPRSSESFFNHMTQIVQDFVFHVYPTRNDADYIVDIDSFHHYSVSSRKTIKIGAEPDFTSLRLKMLTY